MYDWSEGMRKIGKITILGNVIVIFLCLILFWSDNLNFADRAMYDFNLKQTMSGMPHEDILVIGIDERSLQLIEDDYPWDRDIYVPFLEQLNQPGYEAAAIAFDMLFVTRTNRNPELDEAFAEVLSRYDNVILPSYTVTDNEFNRRTKVRKDELIMTQEIVKPIPILNQEAHDAHINAYIDSDGVIRKTWLRLNSPEGEIPSLAYKTMELSGYDVSYYLDYHPQAEISIRYLAHSYDFETVSFVDVLNGDYFPENMKDRIVLVGFTAIGIDNQDSGTTPIENNMSLVYAHANIVNQMLQDQYISFVQDGTIFFIILISFLLAIIFPWRLKTIVGVVCLFGSAAALITTQYVMFSMNSVYISVIYPLTALFVSYLVNIAIKSYFENKQKNFITKQFGRYISPDLVKEIAATDQEIKLGGINKDLSILFLDIRGFTTLSEKLKPEEVVDFLNVMFDLITEKALDNHGTIDKFIGDAAMIVFNAPLDVDNHEYYAVKTAYDIQSGMRQVREQIYEKYEVEISVGVGVNTGEVTIGNIGSYLRMDYTAIGDNVNIAARIEAQTVANQILVSETTYERTKQYFDYHCIGEVMMKGKTVPIKLYEVKQLIEEV